MQTTCTEGKHMGELSGDIAVQQGVDADLCDKLGSPSLGGMGPGQVEPRQWWMHGRLARPVTRMLLRLGRLLRMSCVSGG
jgi:hypothetical protein